MPNLFASRLRGAAATAALACAPLAPLRAQEAAPVPLLRASPAPGTPTGRSPTRLGRLPGTVEVGVGAGVAHSSRWYDAGGKPGTVESGTSFSAEVRYWPLPFAGLRLQAGRFDGALRTSDPEQASIRASTFDASVVVRPLAAVRAPAALASAYAFAGGGVTTLDLSGTPDVLFVCPQYFEEEEEEENPLECFVYPDSGGTVGQVTMGAGTDLLRVAGFTIFAEASLHRYKPGFRDGNEDEVDFAVMALPGSPTPRPGLIVSPNHPPSADYVVTRRLVAGVRRTFGGGRETPVLPPPPPPPPSPTTGGVVTVATAEPGAEVYLVPRSALDDDPGLRCRLRPVLDPGSFFKGRTTGAQPLRVPAGPRAWVLVVRQQVDSGGRRIWHVHEQRVQLAGGRTLPVQLNMLSDGRPPAACPR